MPKINSVLICQIANPQSGLVLILIHILILRFIFILMLIFSPVL